jgi:hypothetical protein
MGRKEKNKLHEDKQITHLDTGAQTGGAKTSWTFEEKVERPTTPNGFTNGN